MIQLKNVSKFYYSKGMIASGFSKVNLELDVGEFVVITGESGSGKSTLLNVISGLDSYEEGELYIDGKETSHYLASDFEEYRKKYIGNIFQHFNLVNSYTVYQNVELILRINGYTKAEIKEKVPAIIEKVGLSEYARTKVSKLSGGQKQRVSIARALAKDTSIVVADEPTGNLDSQSAEGISQLLSEISKDKLVIVVTHNYDQFAQYATRKIKMHDGKVVEDEKLKETPTIGAIEKEDVSVGNISAGSKIRLGVRNTFNIIHKFILLLVVFLFVVLAVSSAYTSLKQSNAMADSLGYNDYFMNFTEDRVILKKADQSAFAKEDYEKLKAASNIKSVVPQDILLDTSFYLENKDFSYDAYPQSIKSFDGKLKKGRMPEKNNEVIITGHEDDYYFQSEMMEEILNKKYTISYGENDTSLKVKVVGVALEEQSDNMYYYGGKIYMQDKIINKLMRQTYSSTSKINATVSDSKMPVEMGGTLGGITPLDKVEKGTIIVSEDLNGFYKKGKAVDQDITFDVENIFYKKSIKLKVKETYNKKNFAAKTGEKEADFDEYNGMVYVNQEDYNTLFKTSNYQLSVYVDNTKQIDEAVKELKTLGYVPLALKDTLVSFGDEELLSIIQVPLTVIMVLAVFFISYFVIRLILKSRSSYFSILRMLGLAKKSIRRIMDVELFVLVNIAFVIFMTVIMLVMNGVIQVEYIRDLVEYLKTTDYVILYGILIVMSYLISGKFTRALFKKTAMGSFREEA